MSRKRISPSLSQDAGNIICSGCAFELGPAGQPWKPRAKLSLQPVRDLPGAGSGVHPDVTLRRFSCPGCGCLLDSEVALPGDPFLEDIVHV